MNTRTPEPLDDNERELARILHALPAGEPSASVDAKILRAAQQAIAEPSKKKRLVWGSGWLSLGGLSTAAAAVLTVGVTWQIIGPALMPPPKVNIPMAESVSDDALTVDISAEAEQAPAAEMAAADAAAPTAAEPAAFPAAPARSVAQAAKKSDMVEKPLPGPVESMDRAHSELDEHVAGNSARREQVFAEAKEEQFSRTAAPPPAAAAPSAVQADAAELETVTVTGSRAKTRERTPEDRARDDLRLTPAAWIRKIRSRIANGDVATAKESLKYYAAKYPEEGVPKDLKDLLEEEP